MKEFIYTPGEELEGQSTQDALPDQNDRQEALSALEGMNAPKRRASGADLDALLKRGVLDALKAVINDKEAA